MKSLHRRNSFRLSQKTLRANEHKQLDQLIRTINSLTKIKKFVFTVLKTEEKFAYEHHHWGANKKIMDILKKETKVPKLFG